VSILEISVTAGQDGRGLVRRGGCDDRRRAEQGAGRPGLRCRPAPGRGPGRAAVRRFGDNPGAGAGQPRAEGPARVLELGARSRSWPGPPGTGRLEPGGDRRSARQWPGRLEPADPMPGLRGAPVTAEIPRPGPAGRRHDGGRRSGAGSAVRCWDAAPAARSGAGSRHRGGYAGGPRRRRDAPGARTGGQRGPPWHGDRAAAGRGWHAALPDRRRRRARHGRRGSQAGRTWRAGLAVSLRSWPAASPGRPPAR